MSKPKQNITLSEIVSTQELVTLYDKTVSGALRAAADWIDEHELSREENIDVIQVAYVGSIDSYMVTVPVRYYVGLSVNQLRAMMQRDYKTS